MAEVIAAVGSDGGAGLSAEEARTRLERDGANALPEARRRSSFAVFVGQFKSPLIYLLLFAAAVAATLGHTSDAVVILVVVVTNAGIGAFQEGRAERSMAALRKLASNKARVVRGAREHVVAAREVVVGDVLVLEAGDAVAADARLLEVASLQVAEAALTGESVPVGKDVAPLPEPTPLADRTDMVYAGTHAAAGRARGLVTAIGLQTEIGHIASLAGSARELPTPLEQRVARFGRWIMVAAAVVFVAVNTIGLLRGMPFGEIVMVAVSQVVGMIPEGLPVAMTIALAVGVQRMAGRQAIVRRLAAVETLGSTTVICSDKTGTLTKNEMMVTAVVLPDGRELVVTGSGYAPEGQFVAGEQPVAPLPDEVVGLLEAGVLCNDAQLEGPLDTEPRWRAIGDPTEVALLVLAQKGGLVPAEVRERLPRRAEIPFDSATKLMAVQHDTPDGPRVVIKGAPEVVLELCGSVRREGQDGGRDGEATQAMQDTAEQLAARALRVLAIGVVDGAAIDGNDFAAFRGRVTLLGLFGQIDPPRLEVKDAVAKCRAAGIEPVMVTGDHKATGHAIAAALGIARQGDASIDGVELEQLSDQQLDERIATIAVFARVHPAQKLRIIEAYQRRGEVVAMTGDGVNDAPALVAADVGVAMGVSGTEVAKESAKIVLADDNFATIVAAVEEGRVVYRNIKKAVLLLFSTSAAEVLVLLLAMLVGYPPPFAAVQILWNNLVTEGLITVNLVMEPAEGDEMKRPPIRQDEPLLSRMLLLRMAFMVPAMVLATLGWFLTRTAAGLPEAQVRTETFTLLAICEWWNVLNCRSESKSALTFCVLQNRWLVGGLLLGMLLQGAVVYWSPLGEVFHTEPFGLPVLVALVAVGSLVLWTEELRKFVVRRRLVRAPDAA